MIDRFTHYLESHLDSGNADNLQSLFDRVGKENLMAHIGFKSTLRNKMGLAALSPDIFFKASPNALSLHPTPVPPPHTVAAAAAAMAAAETPVDVAAAAVVAAAAASSHDSGVTGAAADAHSVLRQLPLLRQGTMAAQQPQQSRRWQGLFVSAQPAPSLALVNFAGAALSLGVLAVTVLTVVTAPRFNS